MESPSPRIFTPSKGRALNSSSTRRKVTENSSSKSWESIVIPRIISHGFSPSKKKRWATIPRIAEGKVKWRTGCSIRPLRRRMGVENPRSSSFRRTLNRIWPRIRSVQIIWVLKMRKQSRIFQRCRVSSKWGQLSLFRAQSRVKVGENHLRRNDWGSYRNLKSFSRSSFKMRFPSRSSVRTPLSCFHWTRPVGAWRNPRISSPWSETRRNWFILS